MLSSGEESGIENWSLESGFWGCGLDQKCCSERGSGEGGF